jgi:hypothetical protein
MYHLTFRARACKEYHLKFRASTAQGPCKDCEIVEGTVRTGPPTRQVKLSNWSETCHFVSDISLIKACFGGTYFLKVINVCRARESSLAVPRGFLEVPRRLLDGSPVHRGFLANSPKVPRGFPGGSLTVPRFPERPQGFPEGSWLVGWLVGPSASWLVPGIRCVSRPPERAWRFLEVARNLAFVWLAFSLPLACL